MDKHLVCPKCNPQTSCPNCGATLQPIPKQESRFSYVIEFMIIVLAAIATVGAILLLSFAAGYLIH